LQRAQSARYWNLSPATLESRKSRLRREGDRLKRCKHVRGRNYRQTRRGPTAKIGRLTATFEHLPSPSSGRETAELSVTSGHPAPTRSRVTMADGRSPGSRVNTFPSPSQDLGPSGSNAEDSPLTVAGAAAALGRSRPSPRSLLIPSGEPSTKNLTGQSFGVNNCVQPKTCLALPSIPSAIWALSIQELPSVGKVSAACRGKHD
jgi:hypothetical protein